MIQCDQILGDKAQIGRRISLTGAVYGHFNTSAQKWVNFRIFYSCELQFGQFSVLIGRFLLKSSGRTESIITKNFFEFLYKNLTNIITSCFLLISGIIGKIKQIALNAVEVFWDPSKSPARVINSNSYSTTSFLCCFVKMLWVWKQICAQKLIETNKSWLRLS